MQSTDYTDEQKKDIEARVEKARVALAELNLQTACMPQMYNTGDDVFGVKLISYLQDIKYIPTKSPLQPENL